MTKKERKQIYLKAAEIIQLNINSPCNYVCRVIERLTSSKVYFENWPELHEFKERNSGLAFLSHHYLWDVPCFDNTSISNGKIIVLCLCAAMCED